MATTSITIRPAFPDDAEAVARLAALDSQSQPTGALLLGEVGGEPWAAVAVGGEPWAAVAVATGAAVADPFRPTDPLVALLRERALQLDGGRHRARRRPRAHTALRSSAAAR